MKASIYIFCVLFYSCNALLLNLQAYADDLNDAILKARKDCAGISDKLSSMKTLAGINTAMTGVGTVAGGVALGTGIAKVNVDKKAEVLEQKLAQLRNMGEKQDLSKLTYLDYYSLPQLNIDTSIETEYETENKKLNELTEKSKQLGNWRTGTLAVSTATNIAGTVGASQNYIDDDLYLKIDSCIKSIKNLSNAKMQAHVSGYSNTAQYNLAQKIVESCSDWENIDLSMIDNKARGATISGGIGAGVGLAGTVISAIANTDEVRIDDSENGKKKEKKLNTAANVMAGGTAAASGIATIFNATQISAIKRVIETAEKCEEALQ